MAQEIELKLAFPPAAHKSLLQHPLIAGAANAERTQTLINTYFDTPGLDLRRARIAVRTRKAGARWLQTVKCASSSEGGLSSRPEWEQPYRNERFDFSAIDHAETRQFLERNADRILPVFTTEFRRETRVVEPEPGVRILLMIDSGRISANDRESPISELELELACGNPVHLLDFALRLAADLPLLPE
ncbi:MAG TPA: CYTH domain-containing protein, partial [Rhodocyclaceae bacterium]|nr:CYTH domain-containing protein [Rhodocyclaceae bacterium]